MKYIKTFESFSVNEEILGFSDKEKAEKFKQDSEKLITAWAAKGYKRPNMDEILAQAKKDGYKGKVGTGEDKTIIYRPESEVKVGFSPKWGG